ARPHEPKPQPDSSGIASKRRCPERTGSYLGSSIGIIFHLLTIFGHGFDPIFNVRIVLEHTSELHPRMRWRTDLKTYQLSSLVEACFDFFLQFGQSFFARGTFGANSKRLRAARPIAVSFYAFQENRNFHGIALQLSASLRAAFLDHSLLPSECVNGDCFL